MGSRHSRAVEASPTTRSFGCRMARKFCQNGVSVDSWHDGCPPPPSPPQESRVCESLAAVATIVTVGLRHVLVRMCQMFVNHTGGNFFQPLVPRDCASMNTWYSICFSYPEKRTCQSWPIGSYMAARDENVVHGRYVRGYQSRPNLLSITTYMFTCPRRASPGGVARRRPRRIVSHRGQGRARGWGQGRRRSRVAPRCA